MNATETRLNEQLSALRLLTVQEQYAVLSGEAAAKAMAACGLSGPPH